MKIRNEYIKNAANNIAHYYVKEASVGERMSANLSELASYVAAVASKDVRAHGFYLGEAPFAEYIPDLSADKASYNTLPENDPLVRAKLAADEGAYLADFCKKMASALRIHAKLRPSPALFSEKPELKSNGRVAFAESRILENAFASFQKRDPSLIPSYVRSFSDACEDVAAELADYCILPIENSREGALLTVYGFMERYELCIARVCSIETDGIATKYALLCRGFRAIMESDTPKYIAVRLSGHDNLLWPRLYTGVSVLGVEIVKTVAIPLGYTDGYAHICTFVGSEETLFALLLFLATVRADYTPMGAYEIIE